MARREAIRPRAARLVPPAVAAVKKTSQRNEPQINADNADQNKQRETSDLFTGSAGGSPAPSAVRRDDLAKGSSSNVLLALRARSGRAARAPSEEVARLLVGGISKFRQPTNRHL